MPLTNEQIEEIREELDNCKRPMYFFHDDADGLCSFLLLYRHKKEGKGVVVKSVPKLDGKFIRKVEEYLPDKIFVLDIAMVEQEFIDKAKVPVIWIDHHEPLKRHNIKQFNPRINDKKDNTPVTYLCWQITKHDLWIAAAGCIGDWFLPDFLGEFNEKYPGLVSIESKNPGKILFETKLGGLAKIFSFVLKGNTKDAEKCFKVLTRIESPNEILKEETTRGKFIHKRYEKINEEYDGLLKEALNNKAEDTMFLFIYQENKMGFSGELANELLYRYPDKLIVIGREKGDEIRMSIRSPKLLPAALSKSLEGIEGYGGGHEYACGAAVKKKDFKRFIDNLKREMQ